MSGTPGNCVLRDIFAFHVGFFDYQFAFVARCRLNSRYGKTGRSVGGKNNGNICARKMVICTLSGADNLEKLNY